MTRETSGFHLLLVYNGEYWCDVGWQPQVKADGITKTVGGSGDFQTIQAAIDWFKGKMVVGACVIDVEPGTYDEAVTFENIFISGGSLTLQGDTRVLAGLSYVDGADMNQAGLTNGGEGACTLSNAGNAITVTGAVTNPDFGADGWGSGDTVQTYSNAGAIAEYAIDSVLNNVITLTVAAPAIGNDGTAIRLLPNRRIERTSIGSCITVTETTGIVMDGFYCEPASGATSYGIVVEKEGKIELQNVAVYAEDIGIYANRQDSAITMDGGAVSSWLTTTAGDCVQANRGLIRARYAVTVYGRNGFVTYSMSLLDVRNCIAVNHVRGYDDTGFSHMPADSATARQCTEGYRATGGAWTQATNTNANNNGNGTDYNPAVSDTLGNNNAWITWS
jgi:hypothetical protein